MWSIRLAAQTEGDKPFERAAVGRIHGWAVDLWTCKLENSTVLGTVESRLAVCKEGIGKVQ